MGTNMQVNFTTKFMKKLKKGHAAHLWENINMLSHYYGFYFLMKSL